MSATTCPTGAVEILREWNRDDEYMTEARLDEYVRDMLERLDQAGFEIVHKAGTEKAKRAAPQSNCSA